MTNRKIKWLLLCLLILNIILVSKLKSDALNNSPLDEFEKQISCYNCYDKDSLNLYYQKYQESYSIEYVLNSINFPEFYDYNTISPAITCNNIILVNRKYYVGATYIPDSLVDIGDIPKIHRENEIILLDKQTLEAYTRMVHDATFEGIELTVFSGYRSYTRQEELFTHGNDPMYIAMAGHSEHQTGLAIDVSTKDTGLTLYFENTLSFHFLKNNAYKYGFILRYPKDKTEITGYGYEPWHYRYVGVEVAKYIYENNLTLEEYIYNYTIINA